MKTFLIVASVLAASLSVPTHIDYIPPEVKSTPATPNTEIYAMDIKADNIDLNTICSWQETVHGDITTLTLYTWDGNFYVLEMKTVRP
jgi:hypothetical protein